jgi:RNA polymerase sigma-70 factor (ECF subfamily)
MDDEERRLRLEALFTSYARDVLAYARRRIDVATADDVLSEVFVVAWRRLEEIPAGDPLPWLLACARRVLANQRRGERRRAAVIERLQGEAAAVQGPVEPSDGALARALASIGERDREVLLLVAWEGLSAEQAAAVLGCSRATFFVRLHRARRRLSAALGAGDETPAPTTLEVCSD